MYWQRKERNQINTESKNQNNNKKEKQWNLPWASDHHTRAGHLNWIEATCIDELNETRKVRSIARLTDIVLVDEIASGARQCNASQITK